MRKIALAFAAVTLGLAAPVGLATPASSVDGVPGLGADEASVQAATPTTTAYVTDGSGKVAVVDTASGTVTDWITVSGYPWAIALDPAGSHAYVANQATLGTVSVIDTSTNTVTATIAIGTYPAGVAVDPTDSEVYATNRDDGTVSVIDTSNDVIDTITGVGSGPHGVAFHPTDSYAYVATDAGVSVIDTATRTVTSTISVDNAFDVIVGPTGSQAYVTSSSGVSVIDTATNTVTATIPLGGAAFLALTPYADKLYASYGQGSSIAVIDTVTNTVTKEIQTAGLLQSAARIAMSADGSYAYVTDPNGKQLGIIDTTSDTISGAITDSEFVMPMAVAMNGHPQLTAPGAPTGVRAKLKGASVTLTWTDHGQGITNHQVQAFYYTKGSKKSPPTYEPVTSEPVPTGSAAASYVYDGLPAGRTYVFTVAAENVAGPSEASTYSTSVTIKP